MARSPTAAIPLTLHEALSGILGSVSIACWIFLLIPQLLENFRNGSASAISLSFLLIWFIGDICNLLGAAWAGLVPTVVAIAVYFVIADGVLIGQCWYYNWVNKRLDGGNEGAGVGKDGILANGDTISVADVLDEEEPLLSRQRSGSLTIPGSGRRRRTSSSSSAAAAARRRSSAQGSNILARILEENDEQGRRSRGKVWMKNAVSIVGIVVVGAVGWAIAWGSGAWRPTPVVTGDAGGDTGPLGAQILGYASAVAYLGARIPQIVKNAREKSCEGLSLLFFILSLMGNLTYGAGIIFHSLNRDYIITNVPWLIGSLGTMVEDVVIFMQFHLYAKAEDEEGEEAVS